MDRVRMGWMLAAGTLAASSGCTLIATTCESVFRPGIEVALRDSVTGDPVSARGVFAEARMPG